MLGEAGTNSTVAAESTTPGLTVVEAREITNKIRQNLAVAVVHIKKAWAGRAWVALGYASWGDYCNNEFDEYVKLGRGDRQDLVLELRGVGMSTRAIAAATGSSKSTIAADLSGVQNRTGEQKCSPADPDEDIVVAEIVENPVVVNNVIGLDGKRYPKPKGKPINPDRHPIHKGSRYVRSADVFRRSTEQLDAVAGAVNMVFDQMIDLGDPAIDLDDLEVAVTAGKSAIAAIRKANRAIEQQITIRRCGGAA